MMKTKVLRPASDCCSGVPGYTGLTSDQQFVRWCLRKTTLQEELRPLLVPAIERQIMTDSSSTYRLARRAGKQGARPLEGNQSRVGKYSTGFKHKLLKCKQTVQFATFNTRTLKGEMKLGELTALSAKYEIDVTCIQEHRIYHEDIDIKYEKMGKGWSLVTSSAEKAENNSTIRGVGMLLSPDAYKSVINIETISPRIMIATFNGNPQTTVISCYSPTNTADEEDAKDFCSDLGNLIRQIPKHNIKIVGGDMNAKIGSSDCKGYSYHETTNRNGEFLLDLIRECEMIDLSTNFRKRKGKLWTFTYPNGVRAQLDHILINKKWKNSALDCRAYHTFQAIKSDHRPSTVKIRLSLRANSTNTTKKIPYDWSKLVNDEDVRNEYSVAVRNSYRALQDLADDDTSNTMYDNIMKAHDKAAEDHIPLKKKQKKRIPWENDVITEKRRYLNQCYKQRQGATTEDSNANLESAKQELENAYIAEQEKYIKEKIEILENAHANRKSRMAWSIINEISGRKKTNTGRIKASSPEERIKLWRDHFANLLGLPPVIDDRPIIKIFDTLPIETGDFTMLELNTAIKPLQNNKASGLDGIPAEVWKTKCLNEELLTICNKTYHGDAPVIWRKGGIIPTPKKGNLGMTNNYRGITLTMVAAKIYNSMMLNRLRPHLDPLLRINQNGFRRGRSTIAQILTIRRMVEGIKAKNLPAVLTFVDFQKAFDSIHRGKLMEILAAYGVPEVIVSAINVLYINTEAQVLSPDGDTDFFEILAGVLQGDTLAPFLFITALDYALRIATRDEKNVAFTLTEARSRRHQAITISDTDFADDLALTSNTLEQAQLLLLRLEAAASQIGLHVNESKTKYISYNQPVSDLITLNGQKLDIVNDFLYLGSWINSVEKDVNVRIAKAWTALHKMDIVWKSDLKKSIKISFFRATIESVLLYGSNSWTLTKALVKKLDGTYTRLLRAAQNVSWKQHMTNKQLYGELPNISAIIAERRTQFSGHCWRSKEEVVHKLLLWEPNHGKRSRGRPAKTYVDQLKEDTQLEKEELKAAMQDRNVWRRFVMNVRLRSIR